MHNVIRYIKAHTPHIEAFLNKEVNQLNSTIRPVVKHVLGAGGKRLRPVLTLLTAQAFSSMADPLPLACSLEILHSATLMHDDILDEARLRRGKPAAHIAFSTSHAILGGDALLALSNKLVADYGKPELVAAGAKAVIQTATAAIEEIAHTGNPALSVEEYLDIAKGKTAYIFQAACLYGAILADTNQDIQKAVANYGLNLGIAFQLTDDALDYMATSEKTGKPCGADLAESKITLPLILHLQSLDPRERKQLETAIKEKKLNREDIASLLTQINARGHVHKSLDMAKEFAKKARQGLDLIPQSEQKEILISILSYTTARER